MPWMNATLFKDEQATRVLQVMMLNIVIISFIHAIQSILQSVNKVSYSVYVLLIALFFKAVMNSLMTRIMGIRGPAIVTVFSLLVIFILMAQVMDKKVWKIVEENHFVVKLVSLLVGMYFLVTASISSLEKLFSITTSD